MKRILLISYLAPPLINAESILVWKTLLEMSRQLDVELVTSRIPTDGRVDRDMSIPCRIQVQRRHSFTPANSRIAKIAQKLFGLFMDEQVLWARLGKVTNLSDYDVIYSRSHPGASHILAYRYKQLSGKPWLAQFSDPWSQNPYHSSHTSLRKRSDANWEHKVVYSADYLVFPTVEIEEMYTAAYPEARISERSIVLPHHYMPDLYPAPPVRSASSVGTVSFAYFGDFYGVRSPQPFLDALNVLAEAHPNLMEHISVRFFGNVESKFEPLLQASPVSVERGKVGYFESLVQMTQSDVLLLIDAPSPTGTNPFLASKLIDYLGAGRKILGITDVLGTAANILRRHGHSVVSPHDIQGIAEAIIDFVQNPPEPEVPPLEFTSETVVGQLVEVVDRLAEDSLARSPFQ